MPAVLTNTLARRLFLARHALAEAPAGPAKGDALCELIGRLGLVQIDSIGTVERAHHMILFARRPTYRPKALKLATERDRRLFEHWTHDASILPISHFPHWKHRFRRSAERLKAKYVQWQGPDFLDQFDAVLAQIAERGPVTSGDVGDGEARGQGGWWDWHPSKTALEYLWHTGRLSVLRRDGFTKVYDLTERVIPKDWHESETTEAETIDWLCFGALDRLGFATSGEIAAFYNSVTPVETRDWCACMLKRGELVELSVECADGSLRKCFARPDVVDQAEAAPAPPPRVRVLSPFDPALRDRNRAERLFGFYYRIEIYVPEPKRQYGYYVFPMLEGDRIIGRIDMKADRGAGVLNVRAFWPEAGVKIGTGRLAKIETELARVAAFAGVDRVAYAADWIRG